MACFNSSGSGDFNGWCINNDTTRELKGKWQLIMTAEKFSAGAIVDVLYSGKEWPSSVGNSDKNGECQICFSTCKKFCMLF